MEYFKHQQQSYKLNTFIVCFSKSKISNSISIIINMTTQILLIKYQIYNFSYPNLPVIKRGLNEHKILYKKSNII